MAQLAELVRERDEGRRLVRARRLALEGSEGLPGLDRRPALPSVVAAIEAAGLHARGDDVDGRGQALAPGHAQEPAGRSTSAPTRSTWAGGSRPRRTTTCCPQRRGDPAHSCGPASRWRAGGPSCQRRRTSALTAPSSRRPAQPPASTWSSPRPEPTSAGDNRVLAAVTSCVSDLVLLTGRDDDGSVEVRVVSGATGDAAAGVACRLYRFDWQKGHHRVDDAHDGRGRRGALPAAAPAQAARRTSSSRARRRARARPRRAVVLEPPERESEVTASLVYTDRSVYRPQQKLLWKVLAYRGGAEAGASASLPGSRSPCRCSTPTARRSRLSDRRRPTPSARRRASSPIPPGGSLGHVAAGQPRSAAARRAASRSTSGRRSRSRFKEPERAAAPQPAGAPRRRGALLLRPAGDRGSVRWRVHPRAGRTRGGGAGGGAAAPASQRADGRRAATAKLARRRHLRGRVHAAAPTSAWPRPSNGVTYRFARHRRRHRRGRRDALGARRVVPPRLRRGRGDDRRRGRRSSATGAAAGADHPPDRPRRRAAGRRGQLAARRAGAAGDRVLAGRRAAPLPPGGRRRRPRCATAGDRLRPRWETRLPAEAHAARLDGRAPRCASGTAQPRRQAGEATVALGDARRPAPTACATRRRTSSARPARRRRSWSSPGPRTPLAVPLRCCGPRRASVPVGGTARLLVHSGLARPAAVPRHLPRRHAASSGGRLIAGRDAALDRDPDHARRTAAASGDGSTACATTSSCRSTGTIFVPWDDRELKSEFATLPRPHAARAAGDLARHRQGPGGRPAEAGAAELLAYMYDRSLDVFAPHTPAEPARRSTRSRAGSRCPQAEPRPGVRPVVASDGSFAVAAGLPVAARRPAEVLRRLRHRRAWARRGMRRSTGGAMRTMAAAGADGAPQCRRGRRPSAACAKVSEADVSATPRPTRSSAARRSRRPSAGRRAAQRLRRDRVLAAAPADRRRTAARRSSSPCPTR